MESIEPLKEYLQILAERLLHLSADSKYAHRAGGLRGNMIRILSQAEFQQADIQRMNLLVLRALEILSAAAQEIPEQDSLGIPKQSEKD